MTFEQIYAALDYNWWVDTYPTDSKNHTGPLSPSTMLYFTTKGGVGSFPSVGVLNDNTNREDYVKDYLMNEAAHQLFNGQCTGGITNTPPAQNPLPIYFK